MADVRLTELPALATATDADILHAVDDADQVDKKLSLSAVKTYAQTGVVTSVAGTAPISVTGTATRTVSIAPATTSAAGSMSAADKTKLDGVAAGATANSTDAQLRDRITHTGTQPASTINDFALATRAQVEGTLVAGANITLTPSGSGATRSITIASTAAGGGGGTVTQVTGTAPIQVTNGTTTPAVSITAATTSAAGSMSAADKAKLDGVATGATKSDLGYTAATRTITNTGGTTAVLPLADAANPGLMSPHPGNATVYWRGDGSWAALPTNATAVGVGAAPYRWLTAAQAADPGNGNVGVNQDAWLTATELWISSTDANGTNISAWMGARKIGDRVRVQDAVNAGAYALYIVTAAPVNSSSFWVIPIRLLESAGTEFVNTRPVTVAFTASVVGSDPTAVTGANSIANMISLTQAQYDAIVTKNPTTLYVIVG